MAFGFCANAVSEQAYHLRQEPQLYKTSGQGKVNTGAHEDDNQHIGPKNVVDFIDDGVQ